MVTPSNTRSKASTESHVHSSGTQVFGRVDLLDQSGEVKQSWLIDSQSCQIGSDSNARIRVDRLAPLHASLVFGRRNTLVKCLQGVMTVGTKNVREYLIDEPTTVHLAGASLIVFPTAYVRNSLEKTAEEAKQPQVAVIEQVAKPVVAASTQPTTESASPAISTEEMQTALVNSTVHAVQKSLEPLQMALTSLTGKWEELLHTAKAPAPNIADEIDRRFEQIEQQIPQLSSELGEMNGRLARSLDYTNSSMSSMASEIRERFDFISQRFDEKDDTREESIDSTLSLLVEQLKQIQERLAAAPATLASDVQSEELVQEYRVQEPIDYSQTTYQSSYEEVYPNYSDADDRAYNEQVSSSNIYQENRGYVNQEPDYTAQEEHNFADQNVLDANEPENYRYADSDVQEYSEPEVQNYAEQPAHNYSEQDTPRYPDQDAPIYSEQAEQGYSAEEDRSYSSKDNRNYLAQGDQHYGDPYDANNESAYEPQYHSPEAEAVDQPQEQVVDYQSSYQPYSDESHEVPATDMHGQSEYAEEAQYVSEYQPEEEPQYGDYYERTASEYETDTSSYTEDEPSNYLPVADSDLLSQAQDSDYNPTEYYRSHDQTPEQEYEEPTDENSQYPEDAQYPIVEKTPTATYTPVARDYADVEEEVADEYSIDSREDYSDEAYSQEENSNQPEAKASLPSWFTKDEAREEALELDNSSQNYSELESKLDSAVYSPIRANDPSALDEADIASDFVIEEDPATADEEAELDSYSSYRSQVDELEDNATAEEREDNVTVEEPEAYALPDEVEVEVEVEEDVPSAKSEIFVREMEENGGEELVDDEESVEEYMQRLLARVKGGETVEVKTAPVKSVAPPTAPQTNKAVESAMLAKSLMDSQEFAHRALSDEEYTPRSAAPESSLNLEAMRTLANETARTAIAKSSKPLTKQSPTGKLGISIFGFLIGTSILLVNGITMNVAFLGMICGYLIFLIWGFEATQNAGLTSKRS